MTTAATGGNDTAVVGGRYRLGPLLGAGGMADVYRATDHALDRAVAVKLLRPMSGGEEQRARFVSEARLLASLSHTGLVMVLDAGFDDERPFLVMQLVEGPTFAEVCGEGPCDPQRIESVGAQVAETLDFVHRQGIVHRDVKPGNILLGPGDTAKLADFGIARLIDGGGEHTRTGHAVGTIGYIAPEVVRGEPVTPAADVYSLGLVLLEALTGRREYVGSDLAAARERLSRPPVIDNDLPSYWPDLLRQMTALDPAQRPTPAEVAARLRSEPTGPIPTTRVLPTDPGTAPLLLGGPTTPPPPPRTPPPPPPPPPLADRAGESLAERAREAGRWVARRPAHERALAGVGVVLALLLVIAGVASGDPDPDRPEVPAGTPAELREPLTALHESASDQDDRLERIDAAIVGDRPGRARREIRALANDTTRALLDGEISGDRADAILRAARELLDRLRDRQP